MIDADCMIRSLRLGWLQRVFNDSYATWKRYFLNLLEHVGGIFFLSCNFDVKDFKLPCPFYYELLQWWSEFHDTFALLYLPPLHLKITLSILDKKDQTITILYLFPQRLNIPISPSTCWGILILQSIKSIKSSYYHILLHLNLMQKPSNIKLFTLYQYQIM